MEALWQAMGLSALDTDNDGIIKNGKDFSKRKKLQALVMKTTIADKPDGPQLWATEKTAVTAVGSYSQMSHASDSCHSLRHSSKR